MDFIIWGDSFLFLFLFLIKKKGIGSKPIQHLYLTLMTSLRRYSNPESSYQSKLLSATLLPSHLKIKIFKGKERDKLGVFD